MPTITEVTFYFANPMTDAEGAPILTAPPESHTLTWEQVQNNVGFSLSTGESMFTELTGTDGHVIRIVNGFYFGTGAYGSLLAIQYHYEDGSDGWISSIRYQANNSMNLSQITGNWIKDLSYEEITAHPNWLGRPYIGYEGDYAEVAIERYLPDMKLTLSPLEKTIQEGDSVIFTYQVTHYCSGTPSLEWSFDSALITPISEEAGTRTLKFNQEGSYSVTLTANNMCGQIASQKALITVQQRDNASCELSLTPSNVSIRLGDAVTFDALHPYAETGTWTYDPSLAVIEKSNKILRLKPQTAGEYSITYRVNDCEERAILYVLPVHEGDFEDPIEPPPPPLPATPPETGGSSNVVIDLLDASKSIPPLYKYPNVMKRNARYRGHRESEKVLNDHQEQIYDIRQLHKDLTDLSSVMNTSFHSWFYGVENLRISANAEEYQFIPADFQDSPDLTRLDPVRGKEGDVIQLSGNSYEDSMVGICGIKRRMQQLDERIAEAERRYREYENAYE